MAAGDGFRWTEALAGGETRVSIEARNLRDGSFSQVTQKTRPSKVAGAYTQREDKTKGPAVASRAFRNFMRYVD